MIETRTVEIATAHADERPAKIAVHLRGSGPLAVLLHGYPLDHRMWMGVLHGELSERRTLCAIDLRGHGQSPWRGDSVHTMERLADDVAAVIRTLGDDPVDVAGLSMGGYVALALHERHRDRMRSLVLSNSRAVADNDAQRQARQAAIETVASEGRSAIAQAMLPKLLPADAEALHRAQVRSMIEATPCETIVADLRGMMQRKDRSDELARFSIPTMVIAGEHDPIATLEEGQGIAAAIPDATFEPMMATGHMSPLEDPAKWSAAVAKLWT